MRPQGFSFLKIALGVLAVVGLLLAAVQLSFVAYRGREIKAQAAATLRQLSLGTESFFAKYELSFRTLSQSPEVLDRDGPSTNALFIRINRTLPGIENVALADEAGNIVGSGQTFNPADPPNIASLGFFKQAAAGERVVVMEPHTGPVSNKRVTGIIIRLEDEQGGFRGILGSSIRLDALIAVWRQRADVPGVSVVISSGDEVIFASGDQAEDAARGAAPPGGTLIEGRPGAFPGRLAVVAVPAVGIGEFFTDYPLIPAMTFALFLALALLLLLGWREDRLVLHIVDSERKYKTYVESSPNGIFVADPDGRYLEVNRAACEMTGYDARRLTSMGIRELISPADFGKAMADFSSLRTGQASRGEYRFINAEGEERSMEVVAAAISPDRFLGFCTDSTERRKASETLVKSLEEKKHLMREVHHRVRTMLGLISALADFEKERLEPAAAARMDSLQRKIRTISLIHQYLYRSGKLAHVETKGYLAPLLKDVAQALGVADEARWSFEAEDFTLHIDEMLPLGLITAELFGNALRHAFPDGQAGKVAVSLVQRDGSCILEIQDDGVGLPAGDAVKKQPGSGRFLVELLVEQLGGSLIRLPGPGTGLRLSFAPKDRG